MNGGVNSGRLALLMAAAVALVAYIYVILRAYYVPPFCDEVLSFFWYILHGDMQPFYAQTDANNHVINSALSRVFYLLFGDGIFVLRLANLLAFGVYLAYLFKFKTFFKNQWVWLAWFGVMVVPQYFLDFFHLSRGYGLSMAFLVASFYHLLFFERNAKVLHFGFTCFWIALAVWSNLSLTLTSSLIGLWLIHSWLIRHRSSISVPAHFILLLLFVSLFALPLLYAVWYGFELKDAGMLYYGADSGFWDKSIIMTAKWIADDWILGGVLVINALFVYLFLVGYNFKNRKETVSTGLHLLFWGTVAGIVLMHHLMDVKYPVDRSTNHLFLMFFTILFFEIDRSNFQAAKYAGWAMAFFLLFNTVANANLSLTRLWATEHVPEEYYKEMIAWKQTHGESPLVTAHGIHQVVLKYYDLVHKGNLNLLDEPSQPNGLYDFVLVRHDDHRPDSLRYETVFYNEKAQSGLFKLNYDLNWTEHAVIDEPVSSTGSEFINLATFDVTALHGRTISINSSFLASSSSEVKDWQLIRTVRDEAGNNLNYYQTSLDETYPLPFESTTVSSKCLIENIPDNAKTVLVFLWNVKSKPITVSNSHSVLYTTER